MIAYIFGEVAELNPTSIIIDINGLGYLAQISLHSYEKLQGNKKVKLYIHEVIREDEHTIYGFSEQTERELFRQLISVQGIGPNIARVMLSTILPQFLADAILTGNLNLLKGVKGIGPKTAQRLITELQDKMGKATTQGQLASIQSKTGIIDEAITAMIGLGVSKIIADKAVQKAVSELPISHNLEELLKLALKYI
ncbi:MAG: Holliday junction branch migration protein RuvA [Bacteroidota bacterium]|nr:Holliday junction branch migration protein RuvA [Bacteroidota bacterium]